jgi:hypothetical protein
MRRPRDLRRLDQLVLFHPKPIVPQWRSFPVEVRGHTLRLLAQFLRHHRDGPAFLDSFRGPDKWNSIGYAATARGWDAGQPAERKNECCRRPHLAMLVQIHTDAEPGP